MKIRCLVCGDIVEAPTIRWRMNYCGCKRIALDRTGNEYRIIGNNEDWEVVEEDD